MPTVLSPAEIEALRAELAGPAYAGLDAAARLDRLHAPEMVPNPTPRGQVPKPFVTADLMGALDATALTAIRDLPSLARLLDDIERQDPGRLDNWIGLLAGTGAITPGQAQALAATVHATWPDPAWTETVPGPTPKRRLFGDRTWTYPDGTTVNFIPLDDVEAASS
jgi:hypothetical protein